MRNIIFFFGYVLFNPRLVLLLFKNIYLPVYVQFEWLKKYNITTVIDVGANQGHVTRALQYMFPEASIYAFEPIKKEADKLCASFSKRKVIVENLALGNKSGKAILYKYGFSPASSLLPATLKYSEKFRGVSIGDEVAVQTTTLDSYFKNAKLTGEVFLKIDTQGTEKQVLEGAKSFLKFVSIIHIETLFDELYKNQSTFDEVYKFLTKLGFEYRGTVVESYFYPNFYLPEAANCVFIKSYGKTKD